MSKPTDRPASQDTIDLDTDDPVVEFAQEVEAGLSERPMSLPCRFLYDQRGSELFEEICKLPEYYLTRTEASILEENSSKIRELTGHVSLIELGSGTSVKTDHLLTAYGNGDTKVRYIPVDVSESAIQVAAKSIEAKHPNVDVDGIVGTYESAFPLFRQYSPSMVVFLGSTIGNFRKVGSEQFWGQIEGSLDSEDFFLLGADLVKDPDVLEAAYNDEAGVTAKFMKNMFARINRELGADIDLDQIEHVAEYNREQQQVELSAKFTSDQEVVIEPLDRSVFLSEGDTVLLEVSNKFVLDDLIAYAGDFGLETKQVFTDDERWFADLLMQKR